MKIIQFITRMDVLGGAQMHVLELSKELASKGHEVIVLGYGTGELTEELEQRGITYKHLKHVVVPINLMKDFIAFFEIRKSIKEIRPDIIAIHSSKAGVLGRLAARSLKIPTIFTAHSWSFAGEQSFRKRNMFVLIEKFIGTFTNGVITVSEFDYKEAVIRNIVPVDKIKMIHNGIHDYPYKKKKRREVNPMMIKLLMVARFSEPKDHILLLQALKRVRSENWHLTFVGDGPLFEDVQRFARSLQLAEKISFVGNCREVTARLRESDLFVLASKSEGLPISIIEAMREGLPVIATNVGGVGELVDQRESGLLVEKGDEEGWIDALNEMMENNAFRKQLGHAARKKFSSEFIFADMYERTEAYYMKIANKAKRRQII